MLRVSQWNGNGGVQCLFFHIICCFMFTYICCVSRNVSWIYRLKYLWNPFVFTKPTPFKSFILLLDLRDNWPILNITRTELALKWKLTTPNFTEFGTTQLLNSNTQITKRWATVKYHFWSFSVTKCNCSNCNIGQRTEY